MLVGGPSARRTVELLVDWCDQKVMTCDFIFYMCNAVISVYRCIFHAYYSIRFYVYVVFHGINVYYLKMQYFFS